MHIHHATVERSRGAKIIAELVSEMTVVNNAHETRRRRPVEAVFEDNQYVYCG
jgi:hypothetical protein